MMIWWLQQTGNTITLYLSCNYNFHFLPLVYSMQSTAYYFEWKGYLCEKLEKLEKEELSNLTKMVALFFISYSYVYSFVYSLDILCMSCKGKQQISINNPEKIVWLTEPRASSNGGEEF